MKRYLLLALTLGLAAAAIAPAASASSLSDDTATDLNGDGTISMNERRIHYLDYSTK